MVSELCDQLVEDVVHVIGAEELRVFSLGILKGQRLSGVLGLLLVSQRKIDFVTTRINFVGCLMSGSLIILLG
jgi:hypothetical protein